MGVKGLHSFIERKLAPVTYRVALAELPRLTGSDVIVVDGMALIRRLYGFDLDWVGGGQFQELYVSVGDFVRAWRSAGLRLVVFFDGGVDEAKLSEWLSRRRRDLSMCEKVAAGVARGEPPRTSSACWVPPLYISKWVGAAFRAHGCEVIYTAGEADRHIAAHCVRQRCAGVLGKDSDFFVLPVPLYLVVDSLRERDHVPTVTAYPRDAVLAQFGLPDLLLPLAASLAGNDFVETSALAPLHQLLMPGRQASGGPLIEAVCAHVRSNSEAAGWAGGTAEPTPAMWDALDPSNLLTADTRVKVARSMSQYALPPAGDSAFTSPATTTPAGASPLAHGAASATNGDSGRDDLGATERSTRPSRPSPSPLLLRRFREGRLDSAIFTAASLGAIWRGAGIEPAGRQPAVLSCAPLRAEVYAICVPLCMGVHGPVGGAAGSGDGDERGACANDGGSVREFLLYSGKERPELPDLVRIPPRKVSFDQLHAMDPEARCRSLLEACARASGGDDPLCNLQPASVIAAGPLLLATLTLRYLLRRRLLSVGPAMLALLAQSIVLARLDVRRERLPPDERGRQLAACPTADGMHASSLFLRASTDLLLINSACCEPLDVAGAWQFFDGPLFHWMLDAASTGSSGRQLMRNDPLLYRLLCSLRPIAFATTDEASLMDAACADVAKRWREHGCSLTEKRGSTSEGGPSSKVRRTSM